MPAHRKIFRMMSFIPLAVLAAARNSSALTPASVRNSCKSASNFAWYVWYTGHHSCDCSLPSAAPFTRWACSARKVSNCSSIPCDSNQATKRSIRSPDAARDCK
jgi:hypothetical protein